MSSGIEGAVELVKVFGGPSAVAALGWWLKTKFVDVKEAGEQRMLSHEHQDERRHRQNIVRLARIETKLNIEELHDDSNGSP